MLEFSARHQHAGVHQCLDHRLVGVALLALVGDDAAAREARRVLGEAAVGIDRVGDLRRDAALLQPASVRHPDVEVLAAVAGRGVDEAGAGAVVDMLAVEQRHREVVAHRLQRMIADEIRQHIGRHRPHLLIGGDAGLLEHVGGEIVGEDQQIAGLRPVVGRGVDDAIEAIGDPVRIADGAVARQRPRGGGPDDDGGAVELTSPRRAGRGNRELHPHGIGRVVLVLDLGLGQRGLLDHRPHHRLTAAIERAVVGELHDLAGDLRLGRERHGGVGIGPVADRAEALELLALHVQPVLRIGAALLAERHHGGGVGEIRLGLALLAVVLLLDLPLDRQAVAVPARHVVGVEAEHLLRARHQVLEHLVERVADVDVAVGVGRPVVQDEAGPARGGAAQPAVEVERLPAGEDLRLLLGQTGPHGEIGHRQEQGFRVVAGRGRGVGHGAPF
ncbi:hypothetical protein RHODGE_RHODGE_04165 [Rhodoplanes serenus]|uniref:Uncharacterized protein n=1 Tax=Rhodoplanes serenus TaxID=200615 RepID=A0A3S4DI67_9BRAD|nr:hypothetical protein RHODGE_RHODGE_04165 [Rhodoplanes serenus]